MPLAPKSSASSAKLQTTLSSWTPLNHLLSNSKVFAERRSLLAKWFDRWSDSQRKAVLQDLVLSCSSEQLVFLSLSVNRRLPLQAADFTCMLPRALCLYIFSFLDPRSLCRCARVSWHWRSIVELDQLWMPKCLRLGWCISFSPTAFEQGVWKRHYIQTVQELRLASLQTSWSQQPVAVPHVSAISSAHEDPSEPDLLGEEHPASGTLPFRNISKKRQQSAPPPWRDSDRHPKDTLRFNYLDNLDPTEPVQKGQMNIRASTCCSNQWKPDDGSRKSLSEAHYKLRKAKSLMFLSSNSRPQEHPPPPPPPPQCRPSWATCSHDHPVTKETASSLLHLARWNAGIHPGPARPAVPRLSVEALRASQRSHRSTPSTPLFEVQPWTVFSSHR
ncbi:F-box only protein 16 isoform X1 [Acanthopagrus latus]|uniref:F-box only protein 16 isoform X1 n=2 Tax=Acanthopagrus latus TaxID=8177 RepID=UPI00187C194C|nr:F-box only protein 16 isoform X1 [Acanthopagrus latus]XP_036941552.1 F-box only protein 16 isoform X1 [Acanthopagrus latus]